MCSQRLFQYEFGNESEEVTVNENEEVKQDAQENTCNNCESCSCTKEQNTDNLEETQSIPESDSEVKTEDSSETTDGYPKPEALVFENAKTTNIDPETISKIMESYRAKANNKYVNYKYLRDQATTNKLLRLAEIKREIKKYKKTRHISEEEYNKLLEEQAELKK